MLGIKLKDKVPCKEIRRRTQVKDIVDFISRQKWKWAGHGHSESPSGNLEKGKDQEEDKRGDGEMIL